MHTNIAVPSIPVARALMIAPWVASAQSLGAPAEALLVRAGIRPEVLDHATAASRSRSSSAGSSCCASPSAPSTSASMWGAPPATRISVTTAAWSRRAHATRVSSERHIALRNGGRRAILLVVGARRPGSSQSEWSLGPGARRIPELLELLRHHHRQHPQVRGPGLGTDGDQLRLQGSRGNPGRRHLRRDARAVPAGTDLHRIPAGHARPTAPPESPRLLLQSNPPFPDRCRRTSRGWCNCKSSRCSPTGPCGRPGRGNPRDEQTQPSARPRRSRSQLHGPADGGPSAPCRNLAGAHRQAGDGDCVRSRIHRCLQLHPRLPPADRRLTEGLPRHRRTRLIAEAGLRSAVRTTTGELGAAVRVYAGRPTEDRRQLAPDVRCSIAAHPPAVHDTPEPTPSRPAATAARASTAGPSAIAMG
jgi:hypothetical protein